MNNVAFGAILALALLASLGVAIYVSNAGASSTQTVLEAHFDVQTVLPFLSGEKLLCEFNSTNGHWITLNLSASTADNGYQALLRVTAKNHGQVFNSTVRGMVQCFNQTITLDYDDSYNVTIAKQPFYNTVWVSGTVDLYHNQIITPSAIPSVPEMPYCTIGVFAIFLSLTAILFKCSKNQRVQQ
jgi:hypothetical protein